MTSLHFPSQWVRIYKWLWLRWRDHNKGFQFLMTQKRHAPVFPSPYSTYARPELYRVALKAQGFSHCWNCFCSKIHPLFKASGLWGSWFIIVGSQRATLFSWLSQTKTWSWRTRLAKASRPGSFGKESRRQAEAVCVTTWCKNISLVRRHLSLSMTTGLHEAKSTPQLLKNTHIFKKNVDKDACFWRKIKSSTLEDQEGLSLVDRIIRRIGFCSFKS